MDVPDAGSSYRLNPAGTSDSAAADAEGAADADGEADGVSDAGADGEADAEAEGVADGEALLFSSLFPPHALSAKANNPSAIDICNSLIDDFFIPTSP
jgi:hypothetical protein